MRQRLEFLVDLVEKWAEDLALLVLVGLAVVALPDVAFEAALAVVELAAAAAFAVVAFVVEAVVLELELEPVVSVEAPELAPPQGLARATVQAPVPAWATAEPPCVSKRRRRRGRLAWQWSSNAAAPTRESHERPRRWLRPQPTVGAAAWAQLEEE